MHVFEFSSPLQRQIYEKLLRLVGPGPAAFWKDACVLMQGEIKLESTSHIVAHLLREVESALRSVLTPWKWKEEKVKYIVHSLGIKEDNSEMEMWLKAGKQLLRLTPGSQQKLIEALLPILGIPQDQARLQKCLIFAQKLQETISHKEQIKAILQVLDIEETTQEAQIWFEFVESLHRIAHRRRLDNPRPVSEISELWSKSELLFAVTLDKVETNFLKLWFPVIEDLLKKPQSTREEVRKLANEIPNNMVTRKYLFDHLESPGWLIPLRGVGFFSSPPEPKQSEEEGTISFPPWPQSSYLARVAAKAPEKVCRIILEIPETSNINIHEDFIEAALNMPSNLAAKIAKKEIKWLRNQEKLYLLLPDKLGELISYLAREGEVKTALELARILLEIQPDLPSPDEDEIVNQVVYPRIKTKFEIWIYEEILEKHVPILAEKAPEETLELICELLETAIEIKHSNKEAGGKATDLSHIWRCAIEDHEQPYSLESMLVSSARDIAERVVQKEPKDLPEVVKWLEEHRYPVFRRIALHILRVSPESPLEIITKRLTDRSIFDCRHLRHEYALLLKEKFHQLLPEAQREILSWIKDGPDVGSFREWYMENKGSPPAEDEVNRFIKTWQRNRLSWIKDSLPDEWKEYYRELVAEFGEPEHPEFVSVTTTWVGPESPKSANDLRNMSVSEIVEYLRSWEPPKNQIRGPSPEGLGRTLSQVVMEDPGRFAKEAKEFVGVDPTYVRYLLSGLRDAIKAGKAFDWEGVLKLCKWAVEQPRDILGEERKILEKDPHWGWARKAIADLLSVGFILEKNKDAEMPIEFRESAWSILEPITNDPDPTPEDEAEYGGSNMDPVTLSINTTRGEAMHAVVRYALWCKKHISLKGIEEIPEAKEVLEQHLDPEIDPSLAIRSVYGQWLPWLIKIDRDWVSSNLGRLFPKETHLQIWEATWASYIETCRPHPEVLEVLREEYLKAIEHMGKWDDTQLSHLQDPDERLAEHLMVFYAVGSLGIKDPLFTSFWGLASDDLRAHAIEFIGRKFRNHEGEVPPEILERMKLLWKYRLTSALRAPDSAKHRKEVAAFGWWFASGKFEDEWAFQQLMKALEFSKRVDPLMFVVRRLADLVGFYPKDATLCFNMLVNGDFERREAFGWRREAKELLAKALNSGNKEAEKYAEEAISKLAAMGFLEFVELLKE